MSIKYILIHLTLSLISSETRNQDTVRDELHHSHSLTVRMHSCSHERDEASAHYFREPETEVSHLRLGQAPAQQSCFFLGFAFVVRLFEELNDLLVCLFEGKGFRKLRSLFRFLDILRTSPVFYQTEENCLFYLEREVMEHDCE